ncbi:MAG: phosphatidylserine decarboxylase [Candidatus Binataceae bacterium]
MIARIASLLHIAPEGAAITLAVAIVGVGALVLGWGWLGAIVLIVAGAIGAFFRDPERRPVAGEEAVISAADGKVCDIGEASIPGAVGEAPRSRRVAVFMSPLNVHVNRAPVSGAIVGVEHTAGEFRAAFRDAASEHNERNVILFADRAGRRHAIVQIAGYLARRIVCRVSRDQQVARGQRVGLIMFGSRVDHYFPLDYRVTVTVGDRVRAGESVLGEFIRDGD